MSELPDVLTESHNDSFVLIANKRARRFLKKRFEGGGPQWSKIANPDILTPEYRALVLGRAPVFAMILHNLHEAGFTVMFECEKCKDHHFLDDKMAERFMQEAMAIVDMTTLPAHETMQ
jgi:hypothetical protein